MKATPTSCASFTLYGQILLYFVRFVFEFAFSSNIFWLRLRRTTMFEITAVSAVSEILIAQTISSS